MALKTYLTRIIFMCGFSLLVIINLVACEVNKAENGADSSYVLVKELEFINQTLEEKESGGYIYRGQIKNNSKYTIKGISIEIQLDDGSFTTIATQDTLLPGGVSAYIECFGPTTGNIEDMRATRVTINMYDDQLKQTVIQYDVNGDKYQYTEGEVMTDEKPSVLISDLKFINPSLNVSSNDGTVSFNTAISNNSDYIITGLVYTFEIENGKNVNLFSLDSIGPYEVSPVLSCLGPSSGNMNDMQPKSIKYSIIDQNGNSQQITYDVRLENYFIK